MSNGISGFSAYTGETRNTIFMQPDRFAGEGWMENDTSVAGSQIAELDKEMLIIKSFLEHLEYTLGKDKYSATKYDSFNAMAYAVRDHLVERWLDTQQAYYNSDHKRVYYISMEFLMGRTLGNSLINLDLMNDFKDAITSLGYDFDEI